MKSISKILCNFFLVECNNELRAKKAESDMAILLRIKFCIKQPDVTDELEDIDPHNLEIDKYKLDKLDSDRYMLQLLLQLQWNLPSDPFSL